MLNVKIVELFHVFFIYSKALEALSKKDIGEIKAYTNPPPLVAEVMKAVLILREATDTSWSEAKRHLGEGNFINELIHFDKEHMSDRTLKKIGQQVAKPDFKPEIVGRVSFAAMSLCKWVRAMEVYGRIYRVVEPKRKVSGTTVHVQYDCIYVHVLYCKYHYNLHVH